MEWKRGKNTPVSDFQSPPIFCEPCRPSDRGAWRNLGGYWVRERENNKSMTPGPWKVITCDGSIGGVEAIYDGSAVAQAQMRGTLRRPNHDERRANASAIAALPELIDLAHGVLAYCVPGEALHAKATAALKKAGIK